MKNYQKRTPYYKILEVVAIAASLWAFYPLLFYNSIDNNALVPIHYNFFGEVNGWDGRFFLWVLPLVGLAFYIGLSILQRFPKIYNYPCKVTEENEDYIYRMGVQLVRHIKVLMALLFAYLNNASYAIAIGKGVGLNNFIIMPLMAGLLLLVIVYSIKMIRYNRKIQ